MKIIAQAAITFSETSHSTAVVSAITAVTSTAIRQMEGHKIDSWAGNQIDTVRMHSNVNPVSIFTIVFAIRV